MTSIATTLMVEMPKPKKTRVLDFPIDPAHVKAVDAAILICIEPRYWNKVGNNPCSTLQAFVDMKRWKFVPLSIAGGVKTLVSDDPADALQREAQFARIAQEIELHRPRILSLTVHRDCGAYGYSKAFGNDPDREEARLDADLWRAKNVVEDKFGSQVRVELYAFDENGVVAVEF